MNKFGSNLDFRRTEEAKELALNTSEMKGSNEFDIDVDDGEK